MVAFGCKHTRKWRTAVHAACLDFCCGSRRTPAKARSDTSQQKENTQHRFWKLWGICGLELGYSRSWSVVSTVTLNRNLLLQASPSLPPMVYECWTWMYCCVSVCGGGLLCVWEVWVSVHLGALPYTARHRFCCPVARLRPGEGVWLDRTIQTIQYKVMNTCIVGFLLKHTISTIQYKWWTHLLIAFLCSKIFNHLSRCVSGVSNCVFGVWERNQICFKLSEIMLWWCFCT